jgi:urea transport system substrate-binding protein
MNTNHHLSKPAMIGKIDATGKFDVIWQSINPIRADVWSKYIPDSARRHGRLDLSLGMRSCVEPTFREW